MTFRQSTLLLIAKAMLAAATLAALVACGDPKYQPPAIVVAFSTAFPPPTALATSATAGIAAVVTNDTANAGVNFTCVPAGQCGSFSPNPVASNVSNRLPDPCHGSGRRYRDRNRNLSNRYHQVRLSHDHH